MRALDELEIAGDAKNTNTNQKPLAHTDYTKHEHSQK